MRKIIGTIILIILVSSFYFWQKDSQIGSSTTLTPSTSETIEPSDNFVEKRSTFTYNDQKMQYLLIFPAGYTQTANQWPLILFLHGSSLRGQDLDLVKNYGPPWVAEQRINFPFVVLAPQCSEGEDWMDKPDILAALLDDIVKKYRIDQERVYLTGTSIGGNGTWCLASTHPEYFAAVSPLAASPKLPDAWDKLFTSMPIWAFHGEKDPIFSIDNDQAMIEALRMQGGTPRLTILPGQGHYIAGVYKNHELYDWFLTHTRQH